MNDQSTTAAVTGAEPVTGKCQRPCSRNAKVRTMDGRAMCRQHADITDYETHPDVIDGQRGAALRAEADADPLTVIRGPHHWDSMTDIELARHFRHYSPVQFLRSGGLGICPVRCALPMTPQAAMEAVRAARLAAASHPAATEQRLPGTPRPREDVLREYSEMNAGRRARVDRVLWDFWAPGAETMHRWRLLLSCGHVAERLASSIDASRGKPPPQWEGRVRNIWGTSDYLGPGHGTCDRDDCPHSPWPDREIVTWDKRTEREHPADPEEVPADRQDVYTPEAWAARRHAEPYTTTAWDVTLSCGHHGHATADPGWQPEDGITRTYPDPDSPDGQRRQEIIGYDGIGEDSKRWFRDGCPAPRPWASCQACAWDRVITGYEYTGPLVPPPPPPPKPRKAPDPKAALRRRIRETELAAQRLRDELTALEGGEG